MLICYLVATMSISKSTTAYELLESNNYLGDLSGSFDERKSFTYADRHIKKPYQMEKLKFLACSVLSNHQGQVRDADSVLTIYELLKLHYGSDVQLASSTMHLMLQTIGMNFKELKYLERSGKLSTVANKTEFQWRKKLIHYSDRARKEKKVQKVVDHLYRSYEITLERENVTCLIMLFNHMIDVRLFTGKDEDLEVVKCFFDMSK